MELVEDRSNVCYLRLGVFRAIKLKCSLVMGQWCTDVQTRGRCFSSENWPVVTSRTVLGLKYLVKAVTPDQLMSSFVGFLPSEQEKLVLNSALTGKYSIESKVISGRHQSHVAYLQHIQFR